jgi:putative transposase
LGAHNSRFRQECLNGHWFLSVADAQERVEQWRRHCNGERTRSSSSNPTPEAHANQAGPVLPRTGCQFKEEPRVLA